MFLDVVAAPAVSNAVTMNMFIWEKNIIILLVRLKLEF